MKLWQENDGKIKDWKPREWDDMKSIFSWIIFRIPFNRFVSWILYLLLQASWIWGSQNCKMIYLSSRYDITWLQHLSVTQEYPERTRREREKERSWVGKIYRTRKFHRYQHMPLYNSGSYVRRTKKKKWKREHKHWQWNIRFSCCVNPVRNQIWSLLLYIHSRV